MQSRADAWTALRVEVDAEMADVAASFLVEEGAPAVLEGDGHGPAGRVRLEAAIAEGDAARVADGLTRYLERLAALHPAARPATIETSTVSALDWTAVARSHHRPVSVGRRLLVAPPWDVPAAPGREVLVIEPGMAFGTGQHATTRGCLAAIENAVDAGGVRSALDVGTGSGILAMALARLGVPRVVAIDNDPQVLPLARENLARNGAAAVSLAAGTAADLDARFDLVVANLLADVLVGEAEALAARVGPGGRLVVSGLLVSQAPGVAAAYRGWRTVDEHREEDWCTLVLRRAA
jgi:ribosomal protein L11 methyltransferase